MRLSHNEHDCHAICQCIVFNGCCRVSLEFPAGLRDLGETVEQAAVRELAEETGFQGRITVSKL